MMELLNELDAMTGNRKVISLSESAAMVREEAKAERERCARVVEELVVGLDIDWFMKATKQEIATLVIHEASAAIRKEPTC